MEELPNGKYKFFERYKDPYTEKLKKVSVTMEKKTPQARNQAILLLQEKINKKLEDKNKNVSDITFKELGEPITSARVIIPLKNHGKKLGIDKNITTHMFRHSHISLLAELGIPLTAIMDRVGHSDSKTTLEIYSHVTQKMVAHISSKLEKIKL